MTDTATIMGTALAALASLAGIVKYVVDAWKEERKEDRLCEKDERKAQKDERDAERIAMRLERADDRNERREANQSLGKLTNAIECNTDCTRCLDVNVRLLASELRQGDKTPREPRQGERDPGVPRV